MSSLIDIEVTNKMLTAIAEEMGIVLRKASFSPNIKERRDFSCAIFDARGNLLAQAAHIPVHLGAMPLTVKEMLGRFDFEPGDVIITNDPFLGGTHLPDITLMSGVFVPGTNRPFFYLVARAHHADVGGATPGSMPLTRKFEDEGVLIRPVYLRRRGKLETGVLSSLLSQVRNPEERKGDLDAQLASIFRGERRLLELVEHVGEKDLENRFAGLLDYGERVMKQAIGDIPDGTYLFEDSLDDDGLNNRPVPIRVEVKVMGERAIVDFSKSSDQVPTGLNTVRSVTVSAVYYVFFCLVGPGYPYNGGSLRPLTVITRPGSLLDAQYPAPVVAGNVETSQRIVDCLLGALSKAIPARIPAASCGSMNNIAIGGRLPDGGEFTYYETIGGGMGARPGADGLSGIQTHMTNTLNTPIEALEQNYPFLIEEYSLRRGSGGKGKYMGGQGIIRKYRFLALATVTLLTERRRLAPYGLNGGGSGMRGLNLFRPKGGEKSKKIPSKAHVKVYPGDIVEIRTPGGGGWGRVDS